MADDPSTVALTVMLFGLSGLFLIGCASMWLKVGKDRERADEVPTIRVSELRSAATVTSIAFGLLGVALVWFAFTTLSSH